MFRSLFYIGWWGILDGFTRPILWEFLDPKDSKEKEDKDFVGWGLYKKLGNLFADLIRYPPWK